MVDDNLLPFSFPAVERKKVIAAFDGGRITSDGGVMLLAAVEKELGIAEITVKVHRGHMVRKMGARSLIDLIGMADLLGMHRPKH